MKKKKKRNFIISFWLFIIGIILLPFNKINNKTEKKKEKDKANINSTAKLLIKEIKKYIKDNYIDKDDVRELNEEIKYLEFVSKKGNDYLIKKAKERLELKFFYVKNKIYVKETSHKNSKNERKKDKKKKKIEKKESIDISKSNNYNTPVKKDKNKLEKKESFKINKLNNHNTSTQSIINKNNIKNKISFHLEKDKKKKIKIFKINSNIYKVKGNKKFNYKNNYSKYKLVDMKIASKNNTLKDYTINKKEKKKKEKETDKKVINFNLNKKKKLITPFTLSRSKSKTNIFGYFINPQLKKIRILDIKFKRIIKKYFKEVNNIYTTIIISIQILAIKNNLFKEEEFDTKYLYNQAVNDISFANDLINDAISSLDDILNYLFNNISLRNKNTRIFNDLINHILVLKNSLVNVLKNIEQKDVAKTLKKSIS